MQEVLLVRREFAAEALRLSGGRAALGGREASPDYYEEHSESVELWCPGSPLFKAPDTLAASDDGTAGATLSELLDQ